MDKTDPCVERNKYEIKVKETRKYLDFFKVECDRKTNKEIKSYFGESKRTIKDLLEALFNLIKKKPKDPKLYFLDFLNMFSRDTTGSRPEEKRKKSKKLLNLKK